MNVKLLLITLVALSIVATGCQGQILDSFFDNVINAAIAKQREALDPLRVNEVAVRINRFFVKGEFVLSNITVNGLTSIKRSAPIKRENLVDGSLQFVTQMSIANLTVGAIGRAKAFGVGPERNFTG